MTALNVVQRLFQHHDVRTARRTIAATVAQQFPLRLLPGLARVALPLVDNAGVPVQLETILASTPHVIIAGATGSGRRLALQQLALRWAAAEHAPFPALVTLPLIDDAATPPHTLLTRWIERTLPTPTQRIGPPLQPARSAQRGWGLLFDGLDELPAARQRVWRTLLQSAPRDTPLIVAVAADEPLWDDTTRLAMQPLAPELLTSWITKLAPPEQRSALLNALATDSPLASLSERLLDVVLLLWVARNGMPASRADVYTRIVSALLGARPVPTLEELQLLAAYDEQPSAPAPGLLDVMATGGLRFVHPRLRDFLAARQMASEARYDMLGQLAPPARTDLACFAVSSAADPALLYAALWNGGHPSAANALVLGQCLRECPLGSAAWTVRITAALARLAHGGDDAQRAEATTLLTQTATMLDAALATFARDQQTHQAIPRVLRLLPPDLAAARATALIYADTTPDDMAWALADAQSGLPDAPATPPPSSRAALARWAYINALASSTSRARLAAIDAPTLDALAHSTASDERIIRAAAALTDDLDLSPDARIAALMLLGSRQHPLALASMERASRDPHPTMRQAALAALQVHNPQQGRATLRQTALDQRAPLELRRDALQRITAQADDPALFAHSVRDPSLPFSTRLASVATLAHLAGGAALLYDLLNDSSLEPYMRAAAARQLGRTGTHDALPVLLALLNEHATPNPLIEHICVALGAIGSITAVPALLELLERTTDIGSLLAAIQALGQLQSEAAIPYLGSLLLDADARLHELTSTLGLNDNALLDTAQLPETLDARFITTLAEANTAADQPTALSELMRREANILRTTVVQALGAIGGAAAWTALLEALYNGNAVAATGEIVETLATLDGPYDATTLGDLLTNARVSPLVRWFAAQQLCAHAAGETVLLHALAQPSIDAFTRGTLAELLGQRGATAALPLLRQIADDANNDEHLRAQAILALGLLDDATSEIALLRLVSTSGELAPLRGFAAEHLPTALSSEGRRVLRELLRNQRPPEPVIAGALRTLGRIGDHEALPLLLRYAQDESAAIAQAALLALVDAGTPALAPVLVRITQNPHVDRSTRLQAVGTLLRIGGGNYLPLLHVALEQESLPLRLQALEHLLDTKPPLSDLLPTLVSRATPPAMRMRLFQYCAAHPAAVPALTSMLANATDDTHLRGRAASALARHEDRSAIALFARIAADTNSFVGLRMRCIAALGASNDPAATSALDVLADDSAQLPSIRRYSAHMLIERAVTSSSDATCEL